MQNEENKLFHQLSCRRIRVVKSLTFGICLSNSGNNLHNFHSRVISHACHIVFGGPRIA